MVMNFYLHKNFQTSCLPGTHVEFSCSFLSSPEFELNCPSISKYQKTHKGTRLAVVAVISQAANVWPAVGGVISYVPFFSAKFIC